MKERRSALPADRNNEPEEISTQSEGSLTSDAEEIEQQAKNSRQPESGENLLPPKKLEEAGESHGEEKI